MHDGWDDDFMTTSYFSPKKVKMKRKWYNWTDILFIGLNAFNLIFNTFFYIEKENVLNLIALCCAGFVVLSKSIELLHNKKENRKMDIIDELKSYED